MHISYEGRALEDPWQEPDPGMYRWTVAPEDAPDQPTYLELAFERGDAVAVDGEALSPAALLARLNQLAGASAASIWSRTASWA